MRRTTFCALAIASIATPASGEAQPAVRDSNGVRIVTHARTARPLATWRIDPKPVVEIGGADGSGPYMFSHIWGVARAATGEIVVTDEPAQELRVFDASGKHLRTFGRKGEGPGEFSQIRNVVIYGDTVYPIDTRRSTAFTLGGKLIRQIPFPDMTPYRAVDPWGAFADGSVIQTAPGRPASAAEAMEKGRQVGTQIEMRALIRIAPDSRSHAVLGIVPTYETYRREDDPPSMGNPVAFAPYHSVAVFSDRMCIGRGVRYELTCTNRDGKANLIIRRDVERVPVTAAARDAYVKMIRTPITGPMSEGHSVSQARLDQVAARTHFAETFPAFAWAIAGGDGELWVSEFNSQQRTRPYGEQPAANETIQWNVFGKDGAWLATIALPARFSPRKAGRDYVLGINKDDDAVERVTHYKLIR